MDSSVEMLFLLERYLKDETCTILVTSIKLHNTIEFGSYHATDTKSQSRTLSEGIELSKTFEYLLGFISRHTLASISHRIGKITWTLLE